MRRFLSNTLICFSFTGFVHAENRVLVESREFWQGKTQCVIGIYVSNSTQLRAIVLPLELREITPRAYPESSFEFDMNPDGRVYASGLGPLAIRYRQYLPTVGGSSCSGPVSGTYQTRAASIDYQSPDATMYASSGYCNGPDDCWLNPGSDVVGATEPSFMLYFDLGMTLGQFEIDTCCVRPAAHLSFVDNSLAEIVPEFTKGIVTVVPCTCSCTADPVCDGATDARDVAGVIEVAFRAGAVVMDSTCPFSRTDVNADGVTDVVDAVRTVYVAFLGQSPVDYFVNRCAIP
jgi:hypothetical protein